MGFCNVLSVATTLNDERVLNTVARITHDLNALSLAKYAANVASNGALDAPIIYGLHCLPLTDGLYPPAIIQVRMLLSSQYLSTWPLLLV